MEKSPCAAFYDDGHAELTSLREPQKIIPAPSRPKPARYRVSSPRTAALPVVLLLLLAVGLASCASPHASPPDVAIHITADGVTHDLRVVAGTTVASALAQADLALGDLDRVTPPLYSLLADGAAVKIIRVRETFEMEQIDIPFERQVVRNEAFPADETRLVQAGRNGRQEITYRVVTEDGVEISRSPIKNALLESPQPEILMIGSNATFRAVPITGLLAYADSGNAWILSGDTGNRLPLTAAGNLDSRVFAISPDGQWLLFSRDSKGEVNALDVVATGGSSQPISLSVSSVPHFAGWSPKEPRTIAYSTVQPVSVFPGWKALNDLNILTFDAKGAVTGKTTLLAPNAEGAFSWWGMDFAWSPDGTRLAYSRADEVGWIARTGGARKPLLTITPFRTLADSVWLPPIAWSADGAFLLTVRHGPPTGMELPADSPVFDFIAVPAVGGDPILIQERAGLYADPVAGPLQKGGSEQGYNVAFLQALRPLESDRSKYRLMVCDRDGSNLSAVFPAAGEQGLSGQAVAWSPDGGQIASVYQGNLWIIDVTTGLSQQITGDGQVTAVDWK
jgi:Tol biopolymer transport system component